MKRSLLRTLRHGIGRLGIILAAGMLAAPCIFAADAEPGASPNKLLNIDVQTNSGNQVQLTLHMSGPAPEPLAFTIDKPARISLDLPNTALALSSRRID